MSSSASSPPGVRTALDYWHRAEVWVATIAFGGIAVILVYDVLVREAVIPLLTAAGFEARHLVLFGSQKIALFLLMWGAFAGIGIATWVGAQLVPKVAFKAVPEAWNDRMNRIADLVTTLFLIGVTIVASIFVAESFQSGQIASGGVRVQVWLVQLAIPVGFASAALRYLAFLIWPDLRPQDGDSIE